MTNNIRAPNPRVLYLTCAYNFASLLDFLEACPLLENLDVRLQRLNGEAPNGRRKIDWENFAPGIPGDLVERRNNGELLDPQA